MKETGALARISNRYDYEFLPPDCGDAAGEPLGFNNCFTAFLVLIFGILVGILLFGIEVFSKAMRLEIPCLSWYDTYKDDAIEELPDFQDLSLEWKAVFDKLIFERNSARKSLNEMKAELSQMNE